MRCKWFDVCELREWEAEGRISMKFREEYCESDWNWKNCKRFQMEEKGEPHDNILPNGDTIK